jgi:hypothetical protein
MALKKVAAKIGVARRSASDRPKVYAEKEN